MAHIEHVLDYTSAKALQTISGQQAFAVELSKKQKTPKTNTFNLPRGGDTKTINKISHMINLHTKENDLIYDDYPCNFFQSQQLVSRIWFSCHKGVHSINVSHKCNQLNFHGWGQMYYQKDESKPDMNMWSFCAVCVIQAEVTACSYYWSCSQGAKSEKEVWSS